MLVYLACKKQFNPKINDVATNFLAVEGAIISGDSTFITLSRTTGVKDTTTLKAELKASVFIEDDQKNVFPLIEKGKGQYALGVTNFNPDHKYRLNIKTSNGKSYQSDFVPMKVTPPIDTVYFEQKGDKDILFYADTHDVTNKARYYRWDFKETWVYTSFWGGVKDSIAYLRYVNVNGNVINQYPDRLFVGTCYGILNSNEILVNSSAKLTNDVIKHQQITRLTSSQKIIKLYNLRVNQYTLTEDGYNYYTNLKKNTEQIGTIFDSQPSITTGNIHCLSNAQERVIGFVSASTVTTKILLLRYDDIPIKVPGVRTGDCPGDPCLSKFFYYAGPPEADECGINDAVNGTIDVEPAFNFTARLNQLYASTGNYHLMITGANYRTINGVKTIVSYNFFWRNCVDCRYMPHDPGVTVTNIRPSYFPDVNSN